MAIAPTLLIGLGGIGCRVVDRVSARLPSDRRSRVLVHGFDTNVNDLESLPHLGREGITQTSQRWTVRQYLNASDDSVREWFPDDSPELSRKTLTEGAGQIRLVSRLAFRAAVEAGALNKLERQVNALFRADTQHLATSVRVMIVSSLAGGTGAGLFLQIAMFLRHLLEERLGQPSVLVRGAFVLPDTLIGCRVLDAREHENVRANAYACLKELDAIAFSARAGGGQGGLTIELEFRPDQTGPQGDRDFSIPPLLVPYDFSFLFDFENSDRSNLVAFDNYLEQVATTTFLQLFSPIAAGLFSEEDNKILELVRESGRNRYAGAGVATLAYPYADLLAYYALCWATDSLNQEWLKLDELYEEELRAYERDLKAGIYRDRPLRAARYLWLLDNLAVGERPEPFFRLVHHSAHIAGERGAAGPSKALAFLDVVDRELLRIIENDTGLQEQLGRCQPDEGLLRIRERAAGEIARVEDELAVLYGRVSKFIPEARTYLVHRMINQDCDNPDQLTGEDCRLNTWLLGKPEPLHPVAVRYTLYGIALELDRRIAELAPTNAANLRAVEDYASAYDLPETFDLEEGAGDRVRAALQQPLVKRLFHNHFDEFIEEYLEKSARQGSRLRRYLNEGLKEAVYRDLRTALAELIDESERYFLNLREARDSLMAEALRREAEHERGSDPTRLYVLAGRTAKRATWDGLRTRLAGDLLPGEISREIYLGQYRQYCQRRSGRRAEGWVPDRVVERFRQDVVAWCERELAKQDDLNLNLIAALRREAEMGGLDSDWHIRQRIGDLDLLARPFVPDVPEASWLRRWGSHPETAAALPPDLRQELFAGQVVADPAFSLYTLIRYVSTYGIKAENLPKFSSGSEEPAQPAGDYYRAYRQRIRMLVEQGNTVTPHLDKRWHLPAYLPDLNSTLWSVEKQKIDRALILGLVYGYLRACDADGKSVWVYFGTDGSQDVKVDGRRVAGSTWLIHEALSHNPALVDKIIERAEQRAGRDRDAFPDAPEHHVFWAQSLAVNILERILAYPRDKPSDPDLRARVNHDLLPALVREILHRQREALGSHRENTALGKAAELLGLLAAQSDSWRNADRDGSDYRTWLTQIDQLLPEFSAQ